MSSLPKSCKFVRRKQRDKDRDRHLTHGVECLEGLFPRRATHPADLVELLLCDARASGCFASVFCSERHDATDALGDATLLGDDKVFDLASLADMSVTSA